MRYLLTSLILLFCSHTWAGERTNWQFVIYEPSDTNSKYLRSYYDQNIQKEGYSQISPEVAKELGFDLPKSLQTMQLPTATGQTLLMDVVLDHVEDNGLVVRPNKWIRPDYMVQVPESNPPRFKLKQAPTIKPISLKFQWTKTTNDDNTTILSTPYQFDLSIIRQEIAGREKVLGTEFNVGKPRIIGSATKISSAVHLDKAYAFIVFSNEMNPLIMLLKVNHPNAKHYAFESKVYRVNGTLQASDMNKYITPIDNSVSISGKATPFIFPLTTENSSSLSPSPEVLDELIKCDPTKFYERKKKKENQEKLNSLLWFDQVQGVSLISSPRVTQLFYHSPNTRSAEKALYKVVISEDSKQKDETAESVNFQRLFNLINHFHNDFSTTLNNTQRSKWAMIVDSTTQYIKLMDDSQEQTVPVIAGTSIIVRASNSNKANQFSIDYFMLQRDILELPETMESIPEAGQIINEGLSNHYFRHQYTTKDGETVGFLYSASPTEHYIVFNTFTLIDGAI